jgi:hypothetical protein
MVTHPFHPLRGQRVEVIRIRRGTDPDLIIRHPDGRHAAIAMSWTNYTAQPEVDRAPVAPPLLDVAGLRQVVQFIEHIRQPARFPAVGADDAACSAIDSDYD